jgi:transcriptional regulator with XRE-family HTH domain
MNFTHCEDVFMKVYEKIKYLRNFRDWTQEEMAEKLQMTPNGYAKIEQGKTDPDLSRLEQISEILGVELAQLVGLNDKNVSNFIENYYNAFICLDHDYNHHPQYHNNAADQTTCKHELEKANLIIEQKDKEMVYLKEMIEQKDKEIAYLKKMIELMEKQA